MNGWQGGDLPPAFSMSTARLMLASGAVGALIAILLLALAGLL